MLDRNHSIVRQLTQQGYELSAHAYLRGDRVKTTVLLRCQPSLNEATQLVRMVRDQESPSQRDRLAELAHALFGEDLEEREEEAPCDATSDLIGVEHAVNECVIWRLERLSRFLGLRISAGRPRQRRK